MSQWKQVTAYLFFTFLTCYAQAQTATVVFFKGGMDAVLSEIGDDLLLGSRPFTSLLKGEVANWSQYQSVCQKIAADPQRGQVILAGHSFGSHAAIATARCLQQHGNIPVNLLITIDTIPSAGIEGSSSIISNNVVKNFNFFQSRDLMLNGVQNNVRENGSRTNIHSRRISFWGISPHSAIDNRVSLLSQVIIQASLRGCLNNIRFAGDDNQPSESPSISSSDIQNRSQIIQKIIPNSCL